jgi:hypothetical protein
MAENPRRNALFAGAGSFLRWLGYSFSGRQRGDEMKVSGRKLLSYLALAVAILVLTQVIPYLYSRPSGLTGATRDSFVDLTARSCTESQVSAPANANIPEPVLERYCTCYAKGMADRLSESRLHGLDGLSDAQREANIRPEVDASYLQCIRELQRAQPVPSE